MVNRLGARQQSERKRCFLYPHSNLTTYPGLVIAGVLGPCVAISSLLASPTSVSRSPLYIWKVTVSRTLNYHLPLLSLQPTD